MRWFREKPKREIWEAEKLPTDVFEAAREIRVICDIASESALNIAALGRATDKATQHHVARYENAKKRALELAKALSDELMLETAINQIVELCIKANDIKTAKVLFPAIQSQAVREALRVKYPSLPIVDVSARDDS